MLLFYAEGRYPSEVPGYGPCETAVVQRSTLIFETQLWGQLWVSVTDTSVDLAVPESDPQIPNLALMNQYPFRHLWGANAYQSCSLVLCVRILSAHRETGVLAVTDSHIQ